jgi:uncharacterized SAM-binding protein YcdF (DUF218 family)
MLIYTLLSMIHSCSFTSKTTRRLLEDARKQPYDIIVVPGVPYEPGGWSRTMKGRIYWSKYLHDQGIARNIMYSGSSVYTPYTEATIMALYGQAIGIPANRIFTETRAEHSTENIYYSYWKAKNLGFARIALASDPFQTKSLSRFIRRKLPSGVGLIPMDQDTLLAMEPSMTDPAIDSSQAFQHDFISLTKREGFWKRLRGTLGHNIDTSASR